MQRFIRFFLGSFIALLLAFSTAAQSVSPSQELYAQARQFETSGDEVSARSLFKQSCDTGQMQACQAYAIYLNLGKGGVKDRSTAFIYTEKACNGGDIDGCVEMASFMAEGAIVPKDFAMASRYFEQGCLEGVSLACRNAAIMTEDGMGRPVDIVKAYHLNRKACQLGRDTACGDVKAMDASGRVTIPAPKTLARAKIDCEYRITPGCFNMGYFYDSGKHGLTENANTAMDYFEKSCDIGDSEGCSNIADGYYFGEGRVQNYRSAAPLYYKACEGSVTASCIKLFIMHRDGKGVEKNTRLSLFYALKACDLGDKEGCMRVGWYYTDRTVGQQDKTKALAFYKRGCELGDAFGCETVKDENEARYLQNQSSQSMVTRYNNSYQNEAPRVCGMVYAGGRATYECMSRGHYDKYYKP